MGYVGVVLSVGKSMTGVFLVCEVLIDGSALYRVTHLSQSRDLRIFSRYFKILVGSGRDEYDGVRSHMTCFCVETHAV